MDNKWYHVDHVLVPGAFLFNMGHFLCKKFLQKNKGGKNPNLFYVQKPQNG